MFNRTLRAKLERAMGRSPVVLLTGARQTGKTTLVKQAGVAKQYNFVSFDDLRFLEFFSVLSYNICIHWEVV